MHDGKADGIGAERPDVTGERFAVTTTVSTSADARAAEPSHRSWSSTPSARSAARFSSDGTLICVNPDLQGAARRLDTESHGLVTDANEKQRAAWVCDCTQIRSSVESGCPRRA